MNYRLQIICFTFYDYLCRVAFSAMSPCRSLVGPIISILCHRFCYAGNDQDLKEYTYGGSGGNRTHVQNAFTLKELQQFFLVAHNLL